MLSVTPCSHGIRRYNSVFQRPAYQNGKHPCTASDSVFDTAAFPIQPDAALAVRNNFYLRQKLWNKGKSHAYHKGNGGQDFPEYIDKFIACNNGVVASKPNNGGKHHSGGNNTVDHRFQSYGVIQKIEQNGGSPVIENRVCNSDENKHRNAEAKGCRKAFSAVYYSGSQNSTAQRNRCEHRVNEKKGSRNYRHKVSKAYRRMVKGKTGFGFDFLFGFHCDDLSLPPYTGELLIHIIISYIFTKVAGINKLKGISALNFVLTHGKTGEPGVYTVHPTA